MTGGMISPEVAYKRVQVELHNLAALRLEWSILQENPAIALEVENFESEIENRLSVIKRRVHFQYNVYLTSCTIGVKAAPLPKWVDEDALPPDVM